jgi:hypothetical protein
MQAYLVIRTMFRGSFRAYWSADKDEKFEHAIGERGLPSGEVNFQVVFTAKYSDVRCRDGSSLLPALEGLAACG